MTNQPQKSIADWIAYFDQVEIPVLKRTEVGLVRLKRDEDNLNGRDLADVVMHDPLMTLKVLHYLDSHRSKRQSMDITTISGALMKVETTPFFRHFARLQVVETTLKNHPLAIEGLMRSMSRARHAAMFAQDWSQLRHDIASDEVVIAALLRDLAEMLMWCFAPEPMLKIRALMQANRKLRSVDVQKHVLGFVGLDLQLALCEHWHLPKLLLDMMDDAHADHPRTRIVACATRLARHLGNGWDDAALPDDHKNIAELLHMDEEEVHERIVRTVLIAARGWTWYGVPPVAAGLPLLPVIHS